MSRLGILESTDDPAFIADDAGQIVETNKAFQKIFGSVISEDQNAQPWPELIPFWKPAKAANASGKQLRVDVKANAISSRELVFDVRLFDINEAGSSTKLVAGVARDVTAERAHASDLEVQATIDPLTGAYNHGQIEILLSQAIRTARRRKITGCFIFIDADNFKSINDSFGHDEGDRVLKQIVTVLKENLRDSDVVARFGGDEFGAILTDSDPVSGPIKAQQLADALKDISIEGRDDGVAVSIGLAVYPNSGETAYDVIKQADTAMYKAKATEGKSVEVWASNDPA
jgi:diguanylate cyclase (GGDEF)-like protein/PAS domain S-box-containing protein